MISPLRGERAGPPPGSVRRSSFVEPATALVVLGALGAVASVCLRKLADFDLPGHLAVGRLVAAHRAPLRVDELSYTHRPVANVEYLSDLTLYAIARTFGPLGLQLLGGAMAFAIAALLVRHRARRTRSFGFGIVALAIVAIHPWLLVRPATASFVFLALELAMLRAHRDGAHPRRIFWLIPIFAVWANVHGFVVIGAILLLTEALYRLACRLARGRLGGLAPAEEGRDAGRLALVALLAVAATTLNQAGLQLLTSPFRAAHDFGHITEWATTTCSFLVEDAPLVLVIGLLTLAALVVGGDPTDASRGRTTPTLHDIGLVLLAFALGRSAVRMLPVAVILVTPLVIRRLGARLPERAWVATGCALATWLVGPAIVLGSLTPLGIGWDRDHFSDGAVAFVDDARPVGHVYNSLALGGWLDWRLFPRFQTFVDHRQGWVHDPATLAEYYASETEPAPFLDLTKQFDFQWAFVFAREGSTLGLPIAHSPSWAMVYWDDSAAVYVRTDGPNARLARTGYRLLRHLTSPGDVLVSSVTRDEQARLLAHDGRLALAQAPNSPRAAFLAGCAAIALRDRPALDAAVAILRRVAKASPGAALLEEGWDAAEARGDLAHP